MIQPTTPAERERVAHLVVDCRKQPYDVYVGRACYGRPGSKFMNPFKMTNDTLAERDRVCDEYEKQLLANNELLEQLKQELPGRVLACWCAPNRCHAHTLAALAARHTAFQQHLQTMATWLERGCPNQELIDGYALCLTESDQQLLRRVAYKASIQVDASRCKYLYFVFSVLYRLTRFPTRKFTTCQARDWKTKDAR